MGIYGCFLHFAFQKSTELSASHHLIIIIRLAFFRHISLIIIIIIIDRRVGSNQVTHTQHSLSIIIMSVIDFLRRFERDSDDDFTAVCGMRKNLFAYLFNKYGPDRFDNSPISKPYTALITLLTSDSTFSFALFLSGPTCIK
jgi:hypothetical protein